MSKRLGVVALTVLLISCVAHPHRSVLPQKASQPGNLIALPLAGTYRIDSSQSELRVLVYRAGKLAHLGHNHVMVNHALAGDVVVGDTLEASAFSFSAPVDHFIVDDAQARRDEGADFAGEVAEDAKSGTLHNMLGASQLNAARFSSLVVKSNAFDAAQGVATATLNISVAGHDSSITAPFSLQAEPGRLLAFATFELRQTAVGLTPYSLLGGALKVQDAMQVKIKIVAAQ